MKRITINFLKGLSLLFILPAFMFYKAFDGYFAFLSEFFDDIVDDFRK